MGTPQPLTDYWKSNERKYCDFCKCWIAANAPSISFHENGKRHKANVTKRIIAIGKQSLKDEKAQKKVDSQMRQMEDAAMKAYALDVAHGGDITAKLQSTINDDALLTQDIVTDTIETTGNIPRPAALPKRAIDPLMPPEDVLEDEEKRKRELMKKKQTDPKLSWTPTTDNIKMESMWCEARSNEGHTYYWNVKNGDTCWEPPKEGYMTLEEYNRLNVIVEKQQNDELQKESMYMRNNADEIAAKYRREELKRLRPKPTEIEIKEEQEVKENYRVYEKHGTVAQPYGQWQTIIKKEEKFPDLQLPKIKPITRYVVVPPETIPLPEPPVKIFKEKIVKSLQDTIDPEQLTGISDSFKKRKIGVKRNVRKQNNDDDDDD